jgi:hypothetical protein
MATKKKKTAKRKPAAKGALARIEAELPKNLKGAVREVEKRLTKLGKDAEKAGAAARRQVNKVSADAYKKIGAWEHQGETAFRRLRRDVAAQIHKLEKNIAPAKKRAKKKATKKKTTKKATKKKATKKR